MRRRHICYAGGPPLILTYLGSQQNTSGDGSTHPGMNFGPANPKRYLIAAIAYSSLTAITSVTIGGVAATQLVAVVSSFQNARSAFFIAAVPTGTSGDVTVNAGSGGVSSVALYSVINLQSPTAVATTSSFGSSPLSMSLNGTNGGFILASAYMSGSPGVTAAWTGLTTVDLNLRFASDAAHHSAGQLIVTSSGSKSLSVTLSGTNAFSCAAISLR
jgi:hypothetical protein